MKTATTWMLMIRRSRGCIDMSDGMRWSADDLAAYLQKRDVRARRRKDVVNVESTADANLGPDRLRGGGTAGRSMAGDHGGTRQITSKYGNRKVLITFGSAGEIVAGHLRLAHEFDSQKEAQHYKDLCLRRQSGQIDKLMLQQPYALLAWNVAYQSPQVIGEWFADFEYFDHELKATVTIDVKSDGTRTHLYKLKKKFVEACHDIQIQEV